MFFEKLQHLRLSGTELEWRKHFGCGVASTSGSDLSELCNVHPCVAGRTVSRGHPDQISTTTVSNRGEEERSSRNNEWKL
jgi:hypothetical protein